MDKLSISQSIYKFKVENHKDLKNHILGEIEKYKFEKPIGNEIFSISKGDYSLDHKKTYWPIFLRNIKQYLDAFIEDFFKEYNRENTNLIFSNYWFQQYEKEDSHPFHIHTNSDYSMVYYVELPDSENSTVFMNHNKKKVQFDLEEGDLILFPSLVFHSSPKNNSDKRKTIISGNLNFVNKLVS